MLPYVPPEFDLPVHCIYKGKACLSCSDRPHCCDDDVIQARRAFERALFTAIISGKPLPTIVTHTDE